VRDGVGALVGHDKEALQARAAVLGALPHMSSARSQSDADHVINM
jgi:hypothetical protein